MTLLDRVELISFQRTVVSVHLPCRTNGHMQDRVAGVRLHHLLLVVGIRPRHVRVLTKSGPELALSLVVRLLTIVTSLLDKVSLLLVLLDCQRLDLPCLLRLSVEVRLAVVGGTQSRRLVNHSELVLHHIN